MLANMHEAKSKLSQLVEAASRGDEVIIAKAGKPIVQLVPYKPKKKRIKGAYKGLIKMQDDFDSPETNKEIERLFEGE